MDPDASREKEAVGRQERRKGEMDDDSAAYHEKRAKEQQNWRANTCGYAIIYFIHYPSHHSHTIIPFL